MKRIQMRMPEEADEYVMNVVNKFNLNTKGEGLIYCLEVMTTLMEALESEKRIILYSKDGTAEELILAPYHDARDLH